MSEAELSLLALEPERVRNKLIEKSIPEPNSGCWLWLGSGTDGYGCVQFNRKTFRAHRLSYQLFVGEVPGDLELDHLCRVRCCINPDHLEPVTRSVNAARGMTGKVPLPPATHCRKGHPFTPENTWTQAGGRLCRQCAIEKLKRWRAANPERVAAQRSRQNERKRSMRND